MSHPIGVLAALTKDLHAQLQPSHACVEYPSTRAVSQQVHVCRPRNKCQQQHAQHAVHQVYSRRVQWIVDA